MPKLGQYPLSSYIKAVKVMAKQKCFDRVEYVRGSKNAYRFEAFIPNEAEPASFWTIHVEHNRREIVWSREDYRKPDLHLNGRSGEFVEILEKI
jgi:hypothetical protein